MNKTPLTRVERTQRALARTEARIRLLREQADRLERQIRADGRN